ncbi:4-hydroxy-tetrahydrodipicolinate synthase [Yunchengibacter salinarum]|uniref:4-hydroxy-tetrahydrodipicolinate synthase n=1 Tax=Yunchengibacter salinarum TaxID=3133399 RepID=UPI0035B6625E
MFKGSLPALITPFTQDGEVDGDLFQKFVDWQIREGSHGLVPAGTTGESPTISHTEHKLLLDLAIEAAGGRVPVLAGSGSNSTREAITLTEYAAAAGADGALVITPYYNKPSQEGLFEHYRAIHDAVDIPIVIYNNPGRSVVNMSVETMARLFQLDRVVGVKDATGNLERVAAQRLAMGPEFQQLSGEDATALGFNAMGGQGCISVTANVAPRLCSQFQTASLNGDYETARLYQDRLFHLHKAMFSEPSPAPVKYACSLIGIGNDYVRRPLLPLSAEGRTLVEAAVAAADLAQADF